MQLKITRHSAGSSHTINAVCEFSLSERRTLSNYDLMSYVVAPGLTVADLELGKRREFASFAELAAFESALRQGSHLLQAYFNERDLTGKETLVDLTTTQADADSDADFVYWETFRREMMIIYLCMAGLVIFILAGDFLLK